VSQPVQFGVRLPVAGPLARPESIRDVALECEALGFDAVWVHDFIVWNEHLDSVHISCGSAEALESAKAQGQYSPLFYESLLTLAYVAGLTKRVRIGVAVLCLPFREPIVTAKQIATLDQLSDGRLILGVGVGAAKGTGNRDFEVLGVPRTEKYRRSEEYFDVMRTIWTDERPSYEGQFVTFEETELNPKPRQKPHPPIWVGGAGPKAVDMAGRFGDGWLPGRVGVEDYARKAVEIREIGVNAGREMSSFVLGSEIYACVARQRAEAVSASERTIRVLGESGGFAQVEAQQAFADHALIGSIDDVDDKVRGYVDAGVRHFEMKFIYRDVGHLTEQLRLFAERILPKYQ
jgi:probable F420-dependent oxidoreductase